eukprot:Nitzschia sp. Nitz4//scaffold201_size42423//11016//12170//NITZ4_007370-RA/size42423-processed-gene-0.18-mRNA-1//-1//CDS//3329541320//6121//frame0
MVESVSSRKESHSGDKNETELKIHVSRIPTKFDADIVRRILCEKLGIEVTSSGADDEPAESHENFINVEIVENREEDDKAEEQGEEADPQQGDNKEKSKQKEHRGFGFVTFHSEELYQRAIQLQTIKGGRKPTSTKLYTMYVRPYATSENEANVCYLWTQNRCHYGDACKFSHTGPGSCLQLGEGKKKVGKCFAFKKGKCTKGDDCPFSHDFEVSSSESKKNPSGKAPSEKDCINWKTKGKCRKGDSCLYRHDPELLKKLEQKRKRAGDKETEQQSKQKQPLCVRVFGMAYDTTEDDIREFLQDCGKIQQVSFPTFEDSGRSKGYCGVWFSSPKAVEKAIELDGQELLGRWLSIQAGKMYLRDWEANHSNAKRRKSESVEEEAY